MSVFHISIRSAIFAMFVFCFMSISVMAQNEVSENIAADIAPRSSDTAMIAQSLYEPNIAVSNFAEVFEYKDYVTVFPNLAVDCVNISLKESPLMLSVGTINVEVRDLSGELAYYSTFIGDKYKTDLHLLTPGLYILRLSTPDNQLIGSYEVKKFK